MRALVISLAIAVGLLASPWARAAKPVFVRGTHVGARITLPDVSPSSCSVASPSDDLVVVTAGGGNLQTRTTYPDTPYLRQVRVLGTDLLGPDTSRVIFETVGELTARFEREGNNTVVVLERPGAARPSRPVARRGPVARGPVARQPRASESDMSALERELGGVSTGSSEMAAAELDLEVARARARLAELRRSLSADVPAPPPRVEMPAPSPPLGSAFSDVQPSPLGSAFGSATPSGSAPSRAVRAQLVAGMAVVPSGEFVMGTPAGMGFADESPQRVVYLPPFEIDVTEVTVEDFQESGLNLPPQPEWNWDPTQPVVNVTYWEAREYCRVHGKRLPTEAEWEKAARGPNGLTFPWGDRFNVGRVNSGVDGDGFAHAAPVGSFPDGASPYGALEMAGNVWEWVADWYDEDYYRRAATTDPNGPDRGVRRVVRGGSFRGQSATNVRAAVRQPLKAPQRLDHVGFRCAR